MNFFVTKNKTKLLIVAICFVLTGCTSIPSKLGISELAWSSYSSEKKKSMLANYTKIVDEHKNVKEGQDYIQASDTFLMVSIYDGKIMFPPAFINWQNYQPVQFTILPGQCNNVEIVHRSNDNLKTTLRVCFIDNVLYLDPSYYELAKKIGSMCIHSSPLWLTGFAYKGVNSSGYVHLSNATVEIKQVKNR